MPHASLEKVVRDDKTCYRLRSGSLKSFLHFGRAEVYGPVRVECRERLCSWPIPMCDRVWRCSLSAQAVHATVGQIVGIPLHWELAAPESEDGQFASARELSKTLDVA
jgi:hypothetical protein